MNEAIAALALQYGDYRRFGYRVERFDPTRAQWILYDPDGAQLQTSGYGGIAPTRAACVLEAYTRIAQDTECARIRRLSRRNGRTRPQRPNKAEQCAPR